MQYASAVHKRLLLNCWQLVLDLTCETQLPQLQKGVKARLKLQLAVACKWLARACLMALGFTQICSPNKAGSLPEQMPLLEHDTEQCFDFP